MQAKGAVRMVNCPSSPGTAPVLAVWVLSLGNSSIPGDQESWSSVEHSMLDPRTKPQPGSEYMEVFLIWLSLPTSFPTYRVGFLFGNKKQ